MPQASEIAWLIPVFPLIGAVLSGLGLISINKKINNSREIVSVGLISFVGISAVISYKALIEQVNGYQSVEKLFVWANACLLYTSPSPRDRQKSRMPSSA